jgi:hypothetical protein
MQHLPVFNIRRLRHLDKTTLFFLPIILGSVIFGNYYVVDAYGQTTTRSQESDFKDSLDGSPYQSLNLSSNNLTANKCQNVTDSKPESISVETGKAIYTPLEGIAAHVDVLDGNACPIAAKVDFEIAKVDHIEKKVYQQSFFSSENCLQGSFLDTYTITLDEAGKYNITATTLINGINQKAWKLIQVQEMYSSRFSFMWFVGLGFFISLVVLVLKGSNNTQLNEILRFVFISGIIFSILSSFIFLNDQVSSIAPIGIVKKFPEDSSLSPSVGGDSSQIDCKNNANPAGDLTLGDSEWVLNIGGGAPRYVHGIQVPIGVIIFGIAGGYLRYLYEMSKLRNKQTDPSKKSNDNTQNERMNLFYRSLQDISLLFLSPLLAIAVWFLLSQAGLNSTTATSTIAVVSFTVGLITEDVIHALIRFSSSAIGRKKQGTENNLEATS